MQAAILGGTGVYGIDGLELRPQTVETPFGEARLFLAQGVAQGLIFLTRHGEAHDIPPHRVNYRANLMALRQLGVRQAVGIYTVGSLDESLPPGGMVCLDQCLDFTHGRASTFFDGGEYGLAHTDFTYPFCPELRRRVLESAPPFELEIRPTGTYAGFNGPRLETAAEVRMAAQLGGDVVGMTALPEAPLARELGIHLAGVAISVNYGAGLHGDNEIEIDRSGLDAIRETLLRMCIEVLSQPIPSACKCESAVRVFSPPRAWTYKPPSES